MSDHAGIYERLTVLEYLEFFAAAHRVANATAVTTAVLELVGLGAMADKLVGTLSKGLCQRLQFARVLLPDPKLLILDEPASDLDPRARIEMRDLLLELRELGKTIFLSSHILSELSDVCTSVGIIDHGRLVVSGPIGVLGHDLRGGPLPPVAGNGANAEPPRVVEATPAGVAVPPSSQRRLKLRVLGGTDNLKPLLATCPPIRQIESDDGVQVVLRYVGDEQFVAELVRYLVSHGVQLVSVEPERNRLEQVFLDVTRGAAP
jgi:ABC-2 type transport system ATP-binding protein